jgi:hypothetical protein
MTHMRRIISFSALLFLTGCATVGQHQQQCEKMHTKFSDVVSCLERRVEADPFLGNAAHGSSDLMKLYLLSARKLAVDVNKKKISDLDARIELATIYTTLKSMERGRHHEDTRLNQSQALVDAITR